MPRKNLPSEPEPDARIDLHGLAPDAALRALARELHAARLRHLRQVLVITGRGWGNAEQKPILRPKIEAFLRGPDGARYRVAGFTVEPHGGALRVNLADDARPRDGEDSVEPFESDFEA